MTGNLILNDEEISLKPNTIIALTFQVSDVADVANRKGSGSNSFHVPRTQQNISKLGHSNKTTSTSDIPYTKIPAKYVQNGIQIIKSGYGELSEVADDFEITLYDGNTPFFEQIADKKLGDINFRDLDHVWEMDEIVAKIPNTEGIIYPIVDYGDAREFERTVWGDKLLPWIFLHTVIERIFSDAGWILKGAILESETYQNLIIPTTTNNEDEFYLLASATSVASQNADIGGQAGIFETITNNPLSVIAPPGSMRYLPGSYTRYYAYISGVYSFKLTINYTISGNALGNNGGYFNIHNAVTGGFYHEQSIPGDPTPFSIITGTVVAFIENVELTAGDAVEVTFASNVVGQIMALEPGSVFECISANGKMIFGIVFSIGNNLPDITQKNLLKAFMQMFCVIPMTNTFTKEVHFIQFAEIVKNKTKAPDWTSKVDMSSIPKISFRASTYAQTNYLRYKSDEEVKNEIGSTEVYGSGFFAIPDTTLEFKKDLLELPFSATNMVTRLNGLTIPQYLRFDGEQMEAADSIKDGSPRILILGKQLLDDPGGPLTYQGGITPYVNTDPENLAHFILKDKDVNLGFNNNLLTEHYPDFIEMLTKYKRITVAMKLTAVDIEWLTTYHDDIDAFGFGIPVYFQQFSCYCFINVVSQWIDHATQCTVELVKID